jgi:hypothetical protein
VLPPTPPPPARATDRSCPTATRPPEGPSGELAVIRDILSSGTPWVKLLRRDIPRISHAGPYPHVPRGTWAPEPPASGPLTWGFAIIWRRPAGCRDSVPLAAQLTPGTPDVPRGTSRDRPTGALWEPFRLTSLRRLSTSGQLTDPRPSRRAMFHVEHGRHRRRPPSSLSSGSGADTALMRRPIPSPRPGGLRSACRPDFSRPPLLVPKQMGSPARSRSREPDRYPKSWELQLDCRNVAGWDWRSSALSRVVAGRWVVRERAHVAGWRRHRSRQAVADSIAGRRSRLPHPPDHHTAVAHRCACRDSAGLPVRQSGCAAAIATRSTPSSTAGTGDSVDAERSTGSPGDATPPLLTPTDRRALERPSKPR